MQKIEDLAKTCAIIALFSIPISTSATSVLFPLTALLSILAGDFRNRFSFLKQNIIAQFFFAFFAIYLLGTIYTIAPWHDAIHVIIQHGWIILTPLLMPLFIEEKWRERAVNAFLASMLLTLIVAFIKSTGLVHINPGGGPGIAFKDHISQSFLMSLAFCISYFRWYKGQHPWAYAIFAALILINVMYMSEGRTGYAIFLVLLCYCLVTSHGWKGFAVAMLSSCVLLVACYYLSPNFSNRAHIAASDVQQYQQGHRDGAIGIRMAWQKNALKLIQQKPILGYGTGSMPTAYATIPNTVYNHSVVINDSTSIYLNIALQFGIVGLIFFLIMTYVQWRESFTRPDDLKFLIQTLMISILLGGLANSWLTDFVSAHLYAMFMAIGFAGNSFRKDFSMYEAYSKYR